jgi:hypothetical protein
MAEVARRLTAATDYFVLFSHTEPRDLNGIAERCGQTVARRVAELDRHGRLVWDAVGARELGALEPVAASIAGTDEYDESNDAVKLS